MVEGLCAHPWVCATTTAAALLLGAAPLRADGAAAPIVPPADPAAVTAASEAPPAAQAAPAAHTAAPAATPAGGERPVEQRVKELEDTVRQLQAELARLRAQSEKPPVDTKQVEQVVDERLKKQRPLAGWKDGFFIQSPDGDFRMRLRTQLQFDSRVFTSDKGRTATDSFYLRRARPIIEGTVFKDFDFRIMTEYGEGRVTLFDAYLDYNLRPELRLRGGKAKAPFSLERLQSAPDRHLIERSIANNLGPNRDVGVQLFGDLWNEAFSYQLGAFNGVSDGGSGDIDAGNDKDFVGRIFAQPFHRQEKSPLRDLGVGIAATIGSRTEAVTTGNDRTAARSPYFRYANGVTGDGMLMRLAPQFYFFNGPFGLMGEYISSRQKLVRNDAAGTVTNKGGFLQATYVLTGEKGSFRGVVPVRSFEPSKGQWGAFELAFRYSWVDFDNANFRLGFADRTNSASSAHAWTAGLNWYLNRAFKVQLNYERTDFDHALLFGTQGVDHEDVFVSRLQVAF